MLAMNYRGPRRVRIDQKPIPEILHPEDVIVRVTRSCICGSDLHLYNGSVPDTRIGTTFGHEFTGVVTEVGAEVQKLKVTRPRARAVQYRLRQMRLLPAGAVWELSRVES